MDSGTAVELLRPVVLAADTAWADIGAGDGLFTQALARLLGAQGLVYAVDRNPKAVRRLQSLAAASSRQPQLAKIVPIEGDLTGSLEVPAVDGVLMANVLHYVSAAEQAATLERLAAHLRVGGRLVVAEYDGRPANRWVPHPVSRAHLRSLAHTASLEEPVIVHTRPSTYGGILYVAVLRRNG